VLAQGFREALKTALIVHVHAATVGWDTQKVSNKNQQCLRIGRPKIAIQRRKLFLLGSPRIKLPHIAHKNDLKRRHERWGLCAVQHLEDRGSGEVKVRQAEIP
jgi:hypothetical protein